MLIQCKASAVSVQTQEATAKRSSLSCAHKHAIVSREPFRKRFTPCIISNGVSDMTRTH